MGKGGGLGRNEMIPARGTPWGGDYLLVAGLNAVHAVCNDYGMGLTSLTTPTLSR